MGVPGFFKSFLIKQRTFALLKSIERYKIASVSIDLNGLLHKVFALIYTESLKSKGEKLIKSKDKCLVAEGKLLLAKYNLGLQLIEEGKSFIEQGKVEEGELKIKEGNEYIEEKTFIRRENLSQDLVNQLEEEYKKKLWESLLDIIKEFKPTSTLILAVDGVSNLAKMKQQRQRRFKSALNNNADVNFDSNVITPGTEWMIRIDEFLRFQLVNFSHLLPNKVIYSSHLVPAEGEHKINMYLNKNEMKNLSGYHIVYGLDADLIMLSLLSLQSNIILSRESQGDAIDINKLRSYIINYLKNKHAVEDFVVMMMLLGNDFLPHQTSLARMDDTIMLMMDTYLKNHFHYQFIKNGELDMANFSVFLNSLASEEPKLLKTLALRGDYESNAFKLATNNKNFNINIYREKVYEKSFKNVTDDKINDMATAYMKTMMWNYLYYTQGPDAINTNWMYPYYYSPMLVDLALIADKVDHKRVKKFPGMLKFNALHQLITVLPAQSIKITPIELQPLFKILADLFPATFVNDKEGHVQKKIVGRPLIDYGIAIIPIPDQQRIIDMVHILPIDRLKLWDEHTDLVIGKAKTFQFNVNAPSFVPQLNSKAPVFTPIQKVAMINLAQITRYIKTGQI